MVEYERYNVEIEFVRKVVGALPKHPEVIKAWVESRAKRASKTEDEAKKIIHNPANLFLDLIGGSVSL